MAAEFSVPVLVRGRAAVVNNFVPAAATDRFDPIRFRPVPVRAAVVFSDPAMAIDRSGPIRVRLVPARAAAGSSGDLVTAIGPTIVPVKSTIGTSGTIGARTITLASTTIGITTGTIMTTGSTTTGGAITTTLHWDYGDNFNYWGWAAWPAVTELVPLGLESAGVLQLRRQRVLPGRSGVLRHAADCHGRGVRAASRGHRDQRPGRAAGRIGLDAAGRVSQ